MARVLDLERDQALVAADAMLAMHDEVAFAERRRLGDEALRRPALALRPRQAVAEDVLLADHLEPVEHEAMLQRPDRDADHAGRQLLHLGIVVHRDRRRGAVLLQQMREARRRAVGEARDHDAAAGGVGGLHVVGHLVEQVHALRGAGLGEAFVAAAAEIDGVGRLGRRVEAGELADAVALEQVSHCDGLR